MEKTETINKEEIIYCHHCGTAINSNEKEHLKLFKIKSNKYELCPNCHSLLNFNDKIGMTRFAITSIEKKAKGTIYKSIYNFTFQFFLGKLLSFLTVSTLVFSGYKAITAQVDNNKYLDNDKTVVKDDVQIYEYTVFNVSIIQNENVEINNEPQEIIDEENNENNEEQLEENNKEEVIVETDTDVQTNENSWNYFINGYIDYIRGIGSGEGIFVGAPLTSGGLYSKIASEELFSKDLATISLEDESKTHLYAYFHFVGEPNTFAKLTFQISGGSYLLESDEAYVTSVEGLYE